jgi:hypothetical protein
MLPLPVCMLDLKTTLSFPFKLVTPSSYYTHLMISLLGYSNSKLETQTGN